MGARQAQARRRRGGRPRSTQALHASAPAVRANAAAALYRLGRAPDDARCACSTIATRRCAATRRWRSAARPRRKTSLARLAERDDDRRVRAAAKRALERRRALPRRRLDRARRRRLRRRAARRRRLPPASCPTGCSKRRRHRRARRHPRRVRAGGCLHAASSTKPPRHVRLPGMGLAALIVPMIPGVIWLWIIYQHRLVRAGAEAPGARHLRARHHRHRARVRRRAARRA